MSANVAADRPVEQHAISIDAGPDRASFLVPLYDGERCIGEALGAILGQQGEWPWMEILVVDDRSRDNSRALVERLAKSSPGVQLRLLDGAGQGVTAALNRGVAAARGDVVCQVDQDVVVAPGWSRALRAALADPGIAAAQGWYQTDRGGSRWARVAGLDVEDRWSRIRGVEVDHVCTGNTAYRRAALLAAGGFDESLGYGADVDLSYRLRARGHRLVIARAAHSRHGWRSTLGGYLRQQYGQGYGRLDAVARHPRRATGDHVAPWPMMAHVPLAFIALKLVAIAAAVWSWGGDPLLPLAAAATLVALLAGERLVAGVAAWRRFGDPAALLFPVAHLLRDLAWLTALARWCWRRLWRVPPRSSHSMRR